MQEREQIQYVGLERIAAKPQVRSRFDEEAQCGLEGSMAEIGQQQPIRVRQERQGYVVVDGERRTRAAKALGWKEIACIVEGKALSPGEVIQRQLIANCQREGLTPLEKARAIVALQEATAWNGAETAKHLGLKSAGTVSKLTALLTLPPEVLAKFEGGNIPWSTAYELTQAEAANLPELVRQVENGASRDAIAGAVRRPRTANGKAVSKVRCSLGGDRAVMVSASGLTMDRFIEMLEEVLGKARKARTQGLEVNTLARMFKDTARA